MSLRIFYDSRCPLCVMEMHALKARDVNEQLILEDIWQENFKQRFPSIDPVEANRILHAVDDSVGDKGELFLGLDVTAEAWARVGVKRYRLLRWPLLRPLADVFYRYFARHRYRISKWLTGQSRLCPDEGCMIAERTADERL